VSYMLNFSMLYVLRLYILFVLFSHLQPSSSLRAAELLEASAAGAPFVGFGLPAATGGLEPAFGSSASLGGEEGTESGLDDTDFSLVLKRLGKKDATTKLKVSIRVTVHSSSPCGLVKGDLKQCGLLNC